MQNEIITGTINHWYIENVGNGDCRLHGNIYNDQRAMYADGEYMHTPLLKLEKEVDQYATGDVLRNDYVAYKLGDKSKIN